MACMQMTVTRSAAPPQACNAQTPPPTLDMPLASRASCEAGQRLGKGGAGVGGGGSGSG